MKDLLIILYFVLLLSYLSGCASITPMSRCDNGVLTGKVTDNASSAPLAGVKVKPVDGNGMPIASDSSGIYRTTRFICVSEEVDIATDAYPGYEAFRDKASFIPGDTTVKDISMNRTCKDKDGDGYGNPASPNCPNGNLTDCDDNDPHIYPGGPSVRISGATPVYSPTVQTAYNAASAGPTIEIQNVALTEDLSMDQDKSLTIAGGYNCGYSAVTGSTSIKGNMVINDGKITIGNIILQK